MNKEIEEKIDQLLDKHIGKVYKDWNEVVKAKEDCRKALANMTKPLQGIQDIIDATGMRSFTKEEMDMIKKHRASKLIGRG
jgi:Glu-tRNA(Gln) amidotransferase subunit E-like FAD-binding protein